MATVIGTKMVGGRPGLGGCAVRRPGLGPWWRQPLSMVPSVPEPSEASAQAIAYFSSTLAGHGPPPVALVRWRRNTPAGRGRSDDLDLGNSRVLKAQSAQRASPLHATQCVKSKLDGGREKVLRCTRDMEGESKLPGSEVLQQPRQFGPNQER